MEIRLSDRTGPNKYVDLTENVNPDEVRLLNIAPHPFVVHAHLLPIAPSVVLTGRENQQ